MSFRIGHFAFGFGAGLVGELGMVGLIALATGSVPGPLAMIAGAVVVWWLVGAACDSAVRMPPGRKVTLGIIGQGDYATTIDGEAPQR